MKKVVLILSLLALATSIYLLSYEVQQDNFPSIILTFSIAFLSYFLVYKLRNQCHFKSWVLLFLIINLIPLLAPASLSPDVYRFIWDGDIILQGINPFEYTPSDLINIEKFQWTERLKTVYENGITDLSKQNFSVYPTVNQLYFVIASYFTESVFSFFIALRLLILGTNILGGIFLIKLLDYFSISRVKSLLVALNPLLIIELTGNFHFEGVMVSFLLIAIYFLVKLKPWKSSLFWAISVNVKLSPLLLLPFVLKFLGIKKSIKFYFLTLIFSALLIVVSVWPSLMHHFFKSVNLYFGTFEFNSSFFGWSVLLCSEYFEGNFIEKLGPIFSYLNLGVLVLLALLVKVKNARQMLVLMTFAYVIYLLFSTTVHPWYITIPLVLSVFSNKKFVYVWSFLIVLSYASYDADVESYASLLSGLSYVVLFGFVLVEWRCVAKMTN